MFIAFHKFSGRCKLIALSGAMLLTATACSTDAPSPTPPPPMQRAQQNLPAQSYNLSPTVVPFKKIKVGKPYKIRDRWYTPRHNAEYQKEGVASWYGPGFHGRLTANGETYNQHAFTAAHTTLPLPSIVRVENIGNGKALNVRVNDRGPFHADRIIDLSKAAADKLGIIGEGTAEVRVTFLEAETRALINHKGQKGFNVAYSENFAPYKPAMPVKKQVFVQNTPKSPALVIQTEVLAPMKTVAVASAMSAAKPTRNILAPTSVIPNSVKDAIAAAPIESQQYALNNASVDAYTQHSKALTQLRKPTLTGANSAASANWLQIASYATDSGAQSMIDRLAAFGSALIKQVQVNGQTYYRVLLKPHRHLLNNDQIFTKLNQNFGITDAKWIIQ